MAKFELKFLDCKISKDYIQVEVCDSIIGIYGMFDDKYFEIDLDKSTAIKFAKTLRTEINKITESEGQDGNR
jgi:CheY-specific phosphatase CheX